MFYGKALHATSTCHRSRYLKLDAAGDVLVQTSEVRAYVCERALMLINHFFPLGHVGLPHGALAVIPGTRTVVATVTAYGPPNVALHARALSRVANAFLLSAPATAVGNAGVAICLPITSKSSLEAIQGQSDRI